MNSILKVENIGIQFGGLKAVDQFSIDLPKGSLYGLIGPNGAGKTTVFNLLTGVYQPMQGRILLNDCEIQGKKPFEISRLGLTRTFQNIRLFKGLTVLENVLIGMHAKAKVGLTGAALLSASSLQEEAELKNHAINLLKIFNLDRKIDEFATSLPYGDQRKLEIVRALATKPKLIMLDEPAAGMNHAETHQLMETIKIIRKEFDLTILLIEHDMKLVMGICEHITVLDHGNIIATGDAKAIQRNPKVIEAYLGKEAEEITQPGGIS